MTTSANALTKIPTCQLFHSTRGNREAEILIVGEAWGREEAAARLPFVGPSGKELSRMLFEAGLNETKCLLTNVVSEQPKWNEFSHFLYPNAEKKTRFKFRGVYATPTLIEGVERLEALIDHLKPKLIIGLGNWALWALTDRATLSTVKGFTLPSGVMSWRGSELKTRSINGNHYDFLPTIHPASVLRSWDLRHLVVHDLKARAAGFLAGRKGSWGEPSFEYAANPDLDEVRSRLKAWIISARAGAESKNPLVLSVDLETARRSFITCIGIADETFSLCIPLYWLTPEGKAVDRWEEAEEVEIWTLLRELLESPGVSIVGQNFAYDTQFFARMMGIQAKVSFDTMLAHHLCWPGTPKSLDMLASLYLENYVYWKDESQEWASENDHLTNWTYNCKDTRYTFDIARELQKLIPHFNLTDQYTCQLEQWNLTRQLGLRGVRFDAGAKKEMRAELLLAQKKLEEFLLLCMPEEVRYTPTDRPWYASPTFAADLFYNQLGIQPVLHKKTKKPTLDASSFDPIKKRASWLTPVIDAMAQLRSINVFISHFLEVPLGPDGRIRTSFNVGGTDTFRWSSSANPFGEGTNLQNIPKGDS